MIILRRNYLRNTRFLFVGIVSRELFHDIPLSSFVKPFLAGENGIGQRETWCRSLNTLSYLEALASKVRVGNNEHDVLQSLVSDEICCSIHPSSSIVDEMLRRFEHDWKSALGIFRWAVTQYGFKHTPEAYDKMVDILGRAKQLDKMMLFVNEMREGNHVRLNTIAKAMRRLAGAGKWEEAIKIFNDLGTFGLEKNTEAMNLLLDTLCKEKRVEVARDVFLELKPHIPPNDHTFNIFIHGWCNYNRVDEANWTLQEMKGHGCRPCVISYSIIIQAYCNQFNYRKVYELLDEMKAHGCTPNVVTYTTLMCSLAKSDEFEEALQVYEMMKSDNCKPDTLFYNALIHVLKRAGKMREAAHVFEVEMPMNGIIPNTSTYNTMIAMFCHHSQEENALYVLKEMDKSTFCKPDLKTYNPLLKLCLRSGKADSFLNTLLDDMINTHHLSLDLSTYTLLIHELCRADNCERAYIILEEMISKEITPRYITCRLLLDHVKQKNMTDVADRIEDLMKKMKT
ncbi:hypothetical protein AQUCO_01100291v1 [Aquilegia coerulea]|uniref:Uncharacterized protein n=1 Tax=Aquilegia coerulea TaxID=218851 RepID=A0A2G5E6J4_AQUCA|nr:hypothetical protein AQUCO_01100291v1 [Aquilegia coerulea]